MTKKYLITFGGTEQGKNRHNESYGIHRDYSAEAQRLFSSANGFGFESFFVYDNGWIPTTEEYKRDSRVFLEPSFGWAFKPLAIWYALQEIENRDVLLWVDSNHVFINNPQRIIDFAITNSIYSHDHYPTLYMNGCWTNRDMLMAMGCDSPGFWQSPQMQVNVMAFYKEDFTMKFVEQWKNYACNYEVMIENKEENLDCFKEHRHEQSIFSLLVRKCGLKWEFGAPENVIREEMGINKS